MDSQDSSQDSKTQLDRAKGAQKRKRANSQLEGDFDVRVSENATKDNNGRPAPQIPAQPSNSTSNGIGGKRRSETRLRVPKRIGPRPVKRQRDKFWDTDSTPGHRAVIQKRFLNAIRRYDQLNKYKLLYEYAPIAENEIRLLYINLGSRADDVRVSIQTIADDDLGPFPLQEYEALSYHWGPGPADRPIFLQQGSESEPMPRMSIEELSSLQKWVPDSRKGQRVYVRPNLDKALRYLRKLDETVIL
jgi:hypothetical protein